MKTRRKLSTIFGLTLCVAVLNWTSWYSIPILWQHDSSAAFEMTVLLLLVTIIIDVMYVLTVKAVWEMKP